VESDINSLEHHGLNRCLDAGLDGYRRHVGGGVMSYNLHVIGRELLRRERMRSDTRSLAA
jgi:transposase, IS5 family